MIDLEKMRQTLICVVATLVVFACIAMWGAAASEPARAVIDSVDSTLLSTMEDSDELGFAGRYEKLAATLDERFDLKQGARAAAGAQWSAFGPRQRRVYVDSYRRHALARYAAYFEADAGTRFEVRGAHDVSRERRRVDTDLVRGNGQRVPISYVLANKSGQWRVTRVIAPDAPALELPGAHFERAIARSGPDRFLRAFDRGLERYPRLPKV